MFWLGFTEVTHVHVHESCLHALLRNSNIFIFVSLVVSFVSLLYTRGLFRCFRPCFM